MIDLNPNDLEFLDKLLNEAQTAAQESLSMGLLSDNSDIIGRETAILRQIDDLRKKILEVND